MNGDEYRVIITGELVENADADSVIEKLSILLKQPHETMMRFFGNRPLPLKTVYSLKEAQKVQKYLHSIGAGSLVEAAINLEAALTDTCEQLNDREIKKFVGPNSDKYLKQFAKFQQNSHKRFVTTWHWPAFLVPFYWAIYRKLWGWSVIIFLTTFLSPISNVLWALSANYLYFLHVRKRLAQQHKNNPAAKTQEFTGLIRTSGSTSTKSLAVAILLTMAISVITGKVILDNMREKEVQLQHEIALARERDALLHQKVNKENDQLPESIIRTAEGEKTYLNMNVLIAGMQMATTGKHKVITPGMKREQLIKSMHLQPGLFKDGWEKMLSVWIGYDGFSLRSAGPDGKFGNKDDMLMQRSWRSTIN